MKEQASLFKSRNGCFPFPKENASTNDGYKRKKFTEKDVYVEVIHKIIPNNILPYASGSKEDQVATYKQKTLKMSRAFLISTHSV